MRHHWDRHESSFTDNCNVSKNFLRFRLGRILLDWASSWFLIATRGVSPGLFPNDSHGSVLPVRLNHLIVPCFVVGCANAIATKEAASNAREIEPRFLMNHVDKKHDSSGVGLVASRFDCSYDAKAPLGVTRDDAVDVEVVGEGCTILDECVEIKDGAIDLDA